jgi:hypothetical protein
MRYAPFSFIKALAAITCFFGFIILFFQNGVSDTEHVSVESDNSKFSPKSPPMSGKEELSSNVVPLRSILKHLEFINVKTNETPLPKLRYSDNIYPLTDQSFGATLIYRNNIRCVSCETVYPTFVIAGSQKCGTTSLYSYLLKHPQMIPLADSTKALGKKETRFFSSHYTRDFSVYMSNFQPISSMMHNKKKVITGEGSPEYIYEPLVPSRLKRSMPDVKLIFLIRDPIDRAYSHFNHGRMIQTNNSLDGGHDFKTLMNFQIEIVKRCLLQENSDIWAIFEKCYQLLSLETEQKNKIMRSSWLMDMIKEGLYARHLKNYLLHFSPSQMLVIKSEDFYSDEPYYLRKVCRFLGIDENQDWKTITSKIYNFEEHTDVVGRNTTNIYEPLEHSVRLDLQKFFKPLNEELNEIFEDKFPLWDYSAKL